MARHEAAGAASGRQPGRAEDGVRPPTGARRVRHPPATTLEDAAAPGGITDHRHR
jgi:hypothetical protein